MGEHSYTGPAGRSTEIWRSQSASRRRAIAKSSNDGPSQLCPQESAVCMGVSRLVSIHVLAHLDSLAWMRSSVSIVFATRPDRTIRHSPIVASFSGRRRRSPMAFQDSTMARFMRFVQFTNVPSFRDSYPYTHQTEPTPRPLYKLHHLPADPRKYSCYPEPTLLSCSFSCEKRTRSTWTHA